jgi:two-component system, chemotaxis family, sensor kinase CheA
MKDEFDMSQFTDEFIKEVSDTLEHMEKEMLILEKNPEDRELLNSIFRDAHTIKGSAAFLNFKFIKELTHKMENILDELRTGKMKATGEIIDLLFKSSDCLKQMVNNIIEGQSDEMDIVGIVLELVDAVNKKGIEAVKKEVKIKDSEIIEYQKKEIKIEEYNKTEIKADNKIDSKDIIESLEHVENLENIKKDEIHIKGTNSIRVDTRRIDAIMNMVSELVTGRNRLLQIGQQFHSEELNETSVFIGKVTTEIQSAVMKIRMVPLEKTFSRFSRIVRDLSKQLDKEVTFIVKGQETELDKIVSEEIYEPILHMLRNALDHGIEKKEDRIKAGKNPVGNITVSARQEENFVYIDISDDGKGINSEYIKNKAIEKGIITKEIAAKTNEYDLINIIFLPGFSTASEVSELSGRGVGMDVVKTSIEKIGGLVDIITEHGKGSTFRIRLPLTLAIMQVLIIGVSGKKYAIPLNSVVESIRIEKSEIETISGGEAIFLRGKPLPIVYLSSVFNIKESEKASDKLSIVVLGFGEKRAGLVIDEMFGKLEIVIKPLGNYLGKVKGVSGSAILGDGSIIMILDSGVIVKEGKTLFRDKSEIETVNTKNYFEKSKGKTFNILYVEDSKTLQKIVKREFGHNGIKIDTADDGLMGVRKAETQKYDLIITDYEMPNMDGCEFLTKVRDIRGYKYTPVIVFSARDYEDNKEKWDELNIADYISKPFDINLMMEKVSKIIELL